MRIYSSIWYVLYGIILCMHIVLGLVFKTVTPILYGILVLLTKYELSSKLID